MSVRRPRIEWWTTDVLSVVFSGHVTGTQTVELVAAATRELSARSIRYFVIDAEHASTYSTDVREPGTALLRLLRTAGAERGVAISRSSAIRMIGAAVAFVAGVRVEFVESRPDAEARLADMRTSDPHLK